MPLTIVGFLAIQDPLYRQPHFHKSYRTYEKQHRIKKINGYVHEAPSSHSDYARELPFFDVPDDKACRTALLQAHSGVTKPSAIARLLEVNLVERDPPYGYGVDTSRNFIRIHILRQYRMQQSKLVKDKLWAPLVHKVPFTECFIRIGILPSELWLQILGSLHPIDLYHLSRVNKATSELLSSPSLDYTWLEVFKNSKMPLRPRWRPVSHLKWASLLFGPSACSTCGRRGAVIDFAYARRVCRQCWVEVYVSKKHDPKHPPTDVIWSLLPATRRRVGGHCTEYWSKKKYYRPAVEDIATNIAGLHVQKETNEISELEFARKMEEVEAKYPPTNLAAYENWVEAIHKAESQYLININHHWEPVIAKRLEQMGYSGPNRVHWLLSLYQPDYRSCKRFNYGYPRRMFRKLQYLFPQFVLTNNVEDELQEFYDIQVKQAKQAYEDFRDQYTNYPGVEFLPTPMQLFTMADAPFYSLIKLASLDRKTEGAYQDYNISEYVQKFQEGIKREFLAMLPPTVHAPSPEPTPHIISHLENSANRLELATSIFACVNCVDCQIYQNHAKNASEKQKSDAGFNFTTPEGYGDFVAEAEQYPWQPGRLLVGWRNINGHFSCPHFDGEWEKEKQIVYSEDGANAARSLVSLVGLNPEVSNAEDMDRLDRRFTCRNCPIASTGKRGRRGHWVLTWKECVLHYIEMRRLQDPQHLSPQWRILADAMERWTKEQEVKHSEREDLSWQCLHCVFYNNLLVSEENVISHVKMMHSRPSPTVDEDYKHTFRGQTNRRKPVGIAEHPSIAQWFCGICQGLHPQPDRQLRLLSLRSVLQHVKDKHGISTPEEGREYQCYQAYSD